MHYWLMKNEPENYSIEDLRLDGTNMWDGVRNYQARNFMKEMKVGDMVLYYYSNAKPSGCAGVAKVVKEAYPDPMQFETSSQYYDPKATTKSPRWVAVDVAFVSAFKEVIPLQSLKDDPAFADMLVVKKGMRLSVQPVSAAHFKQIVKRGQ